MSNRSNCGRKMHSNNVIAIPKFHDQIDTQKLCEALIDIARSCARTPEN